MPEFIRRHLPTITSLQGIMWIPERWGEVGEEVISTICEDNSDADRQTDGERQRTGIFLQCCVNIFGDLGGRGCKGLRNGTETSVGGALGEELGLGASILEPNLGLALLHTQSLTDFTTTSSVERAIRYVCPFEVRKLDGIDAPPLAFGIGAGVGATRACLSVWVEIGIVETW